MHLPALGALGDHVGANSGGSLDLSAVDTADGEKILGHIYGGQEQGGLLGGKQ